MNNSNRHHNGTDGHHHDEGADHEVDDKFIAILSCLAVLGLLITIANSTVLVLFGRKSSLRTKTNYFLASLAVSDLLAGSVTVPMIILCSLPETSSALVCIGMDLTQRFLAISTILHLLGATLERYVKIVTPFRYFTLMTARRVSAVLTAIWLASLLSSLVQAAWIDPASDGGEGLHIDAVYSTVCLVVFVLIPFVCIVFAYARIFYVIRNEHKGFLLNESQQTRRDALKKRTEKRAVFIYLAMTITFLLGWLSYFLASLDEDLERLIFSQAEWIMDVLLFFKFFTSLANPLLYTFFKADFQTALGFPNRRHKSSGTLSMSATKAYSLTTLGAASVQRLSIAAASRSADHSRRSSTEPNRSESPVGPASAQRLSIAAASRSAVHSRRSSTEPNRSESPVGPASAQRLSIAAASRSAEHSRRSSATEPKRSESPVDAKADEKVALLCNETRASQIATSDP